MTVFNPSKPFRSASYLITVMVSALVFVLGIITQIVTSSIRTSLYMQGAWETRYVLIQINHYTNLCMVAAFLTIIGISVQQAIKHRHYLARALMLD